jgi:hypothetical protein
MGTRKYIKAVIIKNKIQQTFNGTGGIGAKTNRPIFGVLPEVVWLSLIF